MRRLLPLLLLAACARDLTLPSPSAASLRGRVTKDGVGLGGAEVRLDGRTSAALTRADGAFSFKPVAAGTHALTASFDSDSDGLAELTAVRGDLTLHGGDDLDLGELELRPTGAVSGTVHAKGALVPGALVFVPGTSRVTFTDSNGTYALVSLPAGALSITASATATVPLRRDVEVPSGSALTGIDFDLKDATGLPAAAAFTGVVRFTEAPDSTPQATALAYDGARLVGAADTSDGAFHLGPLAPGVFNVRVDAPNHRTHVLPLEPLGEGDVDLGEIWLEPGRHLVVDGTLVARGTPLQPIQLTARLAQPWGGVVFEATSTDAVIDPDAGTWVSGSVLERCIVEQSNDTGVTIIGSSPALLDSELRNDSTFVDAGVAAMGGGLYISAGSAPLVKNCSIHHNKAGILESGTVSTQFGGGIWSEGDPVLVDNDISFNTCETLRARGVAIAIEDGAHLLLGNTILNHTLVRADMVDVRGAAVWAKAGAHVLAHNRIASNTVGHTSTLSYPHLGPAIAIETANVLGWFNRLENNTITGASSAGTGSGVYAEATTSDLRFNDFTGNAPLTFEVYNTGVVTLDLKGSWFEDALQSDGGVMPVSARVYRPANADLSALSSTPVAGAGPQRCADDAACAPLGGMQSCHHGQCAPRCVVQGCPAVQACDPQLGTCQ